MGCLFIELPKATDNLFEDKIFWVDGFDLLEVVLSGFDLDDAALVRKGLLQIIMNRVRLLLVIEGHLFDLFLELTPHFLILLLAFIFIFKNVYGREVHEFEAPVVVDD